MDGRLAIKRFFKSLSQILIRILTEVIKERKSDVDPKHFERTF